MTLLVGSREKAYHFSHDQCRLDHEPI